VTGDMRATETEMVEQRSGISSMLREAHRRSAIGAAV
jgi:hypothetical protein